MGEEPCVIVMGNLSEGYKVIGPFASFEDACDYADQRCGLLGMGGWIMELHSPQPVAEKG